ncbi:MAG: protease complex subunit PrcB family protein [Pyrinomonadaceae bacterium]
MLLTKSSLVVAAMLLVNTSGSTFCAGQSANPVPVNRAGNANMPDAEFPPGQKDKDVAKSEILKLAEGSHSQVTNAFLVVARDPRVYGDLQKLVPGLPNLLDDFFNGRAVVAAFMGERNTGGYSVEISRAPNGSIRVIANTPPKNAMVTQVITAPFKVVSIPTQPSLVVEADDDWRQSMRTYGIKSGGFSMSGGFAGRTETFDLAGDISVMREGKLVTLLFDLKSSGGEKQRVLREAATGVTEKGDIEVWRIGAGSLIEIPHSDLSARGKFADKKSQLELELTSLPNMIADGYGGRGTIEAEAPATPMQAKPVVNNKNPIE